MKLKKLAIHRMPGFEKGGLVLDGLSSGLNLILGQNGSGKTTCCRSIQGLLWPDFLAEIPYPELVSIWEDQGEELELHLRGRELQCFINQLESPRPQMPPLHLAHCFSLTVDELFDGASNTDDRLAKEIQKDLFGGVDLSSIDPALLFPYSERVTTRLNSQVSELTRKVRSLQSDYEKIRQEELQLERLEAERLNISKAERELEYINLELERRGILLEIDVLNEKISELPEAVRFLSGDEATLLRELEGKLELAQSNLLSCQQSSRSLELEYREHSENGVIVAEEDLKVLDDCTEQLRSVEEEFKRASEQCAQAQAAFDHALRQLRAENSRVVDFHTEGKTGEVVRPLGLELDELQEFHSQFQEQKCIELELETRRKKLRAELQKFETAFSSDEISKGIYVLEQWKLECANASTVYSAVAGLLGAFFVISISFGSALRPSWAYYSGAIALLLVVLVSARNSTNRRRRKEYLVLDLPQPAAWTLQSVNAHLQSLYVEKSRAVQQELYSDDLAFITEELEARVGVVESLERRREEIAENLGCVSDASPLALVHFAELLHRYSTAESELIRARAVESSTQKRCRKLYDSLSEIYSRYNLEIAPSYEAARRMFKQASSDLQRFEKTKQSLALAEEKLKLAAERIDELETARLSLFEGCRISADEPQKLLIALEMLPPFRDYTRREAELRGELKRIERLTADSNFQFAELDEESVRSRKDHCSDVVESRADLDERIWSIQKRIQESKKSVALESSAAEREKGIIQLNSQFTNACRATIAQFLLKKLEREGASASQSKIFAAASDFFLQFSSGRYTLVTGRDAQAAPIFQALDNSRGRATRSLNELSLATRMQLRLAARLAFAVQHDARSPLPFLLDEALSHSDPIRFKAIAQALIALVKAGRQIIYFSSQPTDVAVIEALGQEAGLSEIAQFELGSAKSSPTAMPVTLPMTIVHQEKSLEVPSSEGLNLKEYLSSLAIPELDPLEASASAHIGHLLTEPTTIERLLAVGITTFGQLVQLVARGSTDAYITEQEFVAAQARAKLIDAFARSARIGQGKKLTPEVITESTSSKAFRPKILAKYHEGFTDAKSLLNEIDPSGNKGIVRLGTRTFEELVGNLSRSGHFVAENPLSKDESRERVLSAVNDLIKDQLLSLPEVNGMFEALWELHCGDRGLR